MKRTDIIQIFIEKINAKVGLCSMIGCNKTHLEEATIDQLLSLILLDRKEQRKEIEKMLKKMYFKGPIHSRAYNEETNTCYCCNYEQALDDVLSKLKEK